MNNVNYLNYRSQIEDFTKTLSNSNFYLLDYNPVFKKEWSDKETKKVKKQLLYIFLSVLLLIQNIDKTNFTGLKSFSKIDDKLEDYFGLAYTSDYYADLTASTNYHHYLSNTDYIISFAIEEKNNNLIAVTSSGKNEIKCWLIGRI